MNISIEIRQFPKEWFFKVLLATKQCLHYTPMGLQTYWWDTARQTPTMIVWSISRALEIIRLHFENISRTEKVNKRKPSAHLSSEVSEWTSEYPPPLHGVHVGLQTSIWHLMTWPERVCGPVVATSVIRPCVRPTSAIIFKSGHVFIVELIKCN